MPWFLRVQDGDRFEDAAVLSEAQSVVIGRADTADVPFPRDHRMSSRHLSVKIQDGVCSFSDLHSTNGTFLDDQPVQHGELHPGSLLRCGDTVFSIEVSGQPGRSAKVPVTKSPAADGDSASVNSAAKKTWAPLPGAAVSQELPADLQPTTGFVAPAAAEVIERFALEELLSIAPEPDETPDGFAKRLLDSGADNDCLNFLAYALPKRMGIWWLLQCLTCEKAMTSETDAEVLELVHAWVRTPTDALRRQAMQAAEELELKTPAAWAGVAAFWSSGSMTPEGQPDVPAKDEMAGKAISGACILSSVIDPPQDAPERRKAFTQLAIEIAAGELPWEDA